MSEWSRKGRAAAGWAAVLALALAWAAGSSGGGAAWAAGKPLTLSEALRLGVEASPRLREAQHRLADGEQRLANLERGHLRLSVEAKPRLFGDPAEGGSFWSLDSTLTASYLFRPGGTLSLVADWYPEAEWGAPSSPGSGLAAEVYPRLRLEQVLLRPAETLGLEPDRRRAEVARRRAELEWGQVRQEIDLTIRTAFFELLRAQDALQVAEHRLLRARQNAEAVRRQWQEGRRLAVDVAEAELEAERAALGVEEARHTLAAARRKLADLTGLDPGEPWQPQRPDWAENEGAPRGAPSGERAVPGLGSADGSFAAPLAALQERAARSNLRLRLAALDVELAALEAEVAAQALRPDLRLVASYGKEWSSLSGESNSWSVGFSLRWEPALLPDPARANARLEAEAALRQARQAQEEARREVERQVEELYYAREEKARRVAVAAAAWRKARQALAVVSARAQEGLVGEVEVLQAEEALLQAEADYYAAVYEHHLARVRLAQAVGEVSPE